MSRIVFIGGTGRCGTNIMREILSLHPDIASHSFAHKFLIDPDGLIDFYSTALNCWSPYIIDQKIHRLEKLLNILANKRPYKETYIEWELSKHFPDYEDKCKKLIDKLIDFKYRGIHYGLKSERDIYFMRYIPKDDLKNILGSFIIDLIKGYVDAQGKKLYVDDNTFNILFAKEILDIIPESKFIHMIRDPMDATSSLSNQRWAPKDKIKSALYIKHILDKIKTIKKELPNDSIITIDLYDLVNNPKNSLKDICKFIQIPFNHKLLDIDLSKSNRGRWKKELSDRESQIISSIFKDKNGNV